MAVQIPLQAVPNQTVSVTLNNQVCRLNVFWTAYGLFIDVYVSGVLIIGGVACQNENLIVRDAYLGFSGDFIWFDNSGAATDPVYTGLGTTYSLLYLTPTDLNGQA